MSIVTDNAVVGREPTAEELDLVTWARDAHRKEVSMIHESLRQFVTLLTALLVVSAALLGQYPIPGSIKGAIILMLLGALGLSLIGTMPVTASIDVRCPEEIRRERDRSVSYKTNCLRIAAFLFFLALAFLGLGIISG